MPVRSRSAVTARTRETRSSRAISWCHFCAVVCASCVLVAGCGKKDADVAPPPVTAASIRNAAPPQAHAGTMPHGDHNPHHGGIVMMKGDLHFEVVSDPAGRYRLYFTDAVRADLPAASAQEVSLTVQRPNEADEPIVMRIDDAGESWEGAGRPVADPDNVTVRVAFTPKADQPYWIDLPYALPKP